MDTIRHVLNTILGMYQQKFCREWDVKLRKIISECDVSGFSEHAIIFKTKRGFVRVWCANRWYSYGHLYSINGVFIGEDISRRPRFYTMKRLHRLHSRLMHEDIESRRKIMMEELGE